MHEYTIKEIDGVMWAHYECDDGDFEFRFIDDADAQTQIENFLTEVYIEKIKVEYPDSWEEILGTKGEVQMTPNQTLPKEKTETI